MNFTGKQKALLKRHANERPIMFQIGQNGLTDVVIKNILDNLHKYEVGRVSVLKSCPDDFDTIEARLTEAGIFVIDKIGKVVLLYKENKDLKNRIDVR